VEALGLDREHGFSIERNSASEEADQVNAICGAEKSQRIIKGIIHDNAAKGNSKQRNLIVDGASFERFPENHWMR
jgi:hypothetical protein